MVSARGRSRQQLHQPSGAGSRVEVLVSPSSQVRRVERLEVQHERRGGRPAGHHELPLRFGHRIDQVGAQQPLHRRLLRHPVAAGEHHVEDGEPRLQLRGGPQRDRVTGLPDQRVTAPAAAAAPAGAALSRLAARTSRGSGAGTAIRCAPPQRADRSPQRSTTTGRHRHPLARQPSAPGSTLHHSGSVHAPAARRRRRRTARVTALPRPRPAPLGIRGPRSSACSSRGLAGAHRLAGPACSITPAAGLTGSSRRGPPGAQPPGGHSYRVRVDGGDVAVPLGADHLGLARRRQRRVRVTALRPDHRPPGVHRPAVAQRLGRVHVGQPGGAASRGPAPGSAPPRPAGRRRRAPPPPRPPRPRCRPPGPSGVDMSVSSATVATPCASPELHHGAGQLPRRRRSLHERAGADLDVEHQRAGALGDLLAHDRAGDQRDRLDRAGDVAQRVQLAVGGGSDSPAAQIAAPTSRSCATNSAADRRTRKPGDRLQLVQCAAGVAEAAAGQLRHRGAARRHQRRQRQSDLVADPAGGVLVHGGPATRRTDPAARREAIIARVQRAVSAGVIPRSRIAIASAAICSSATAPRGVGGDHPVDLRRRSARRRRAWPGSRRPRVGSAHRLRLQIAGVEGVRQQVGQRHRLGARRPPDSPAPRAPTATAGTGRMAAAAPLAGPHTTRLAAGHPRSCAGPRPPRTRRTGSSPYEAFSTLQPVTTRPSSTRPAAPTGKPEYGAYARRIAPVAAARSRSQSTSTWPA